MRPWMKQLALAIGAILAVIIVVGLLLPTTYAVKRSIVIEADSEDIHEFVGDLTKWDLWAPWKEEDPTLVVTYGEKTSGHGASQSWIGKDGTGSLRFTAASGRRGIEYDLVFDDGAYRCRSAIRYLPSDYTSEVRWMLRGEVDTPVLGGYLALLMDSMVGPMFERGLARLKQVVEDHVKSEE